MEDFFYICLRMVSMGSYLLNSLCHSHLHLDTCNIFTLPPGVLEGAGLKYQFSVLICETCESRDFRQSTNETASSHCGGNLVVRRFPVRSSQIINIPVKKTSPAKKSVVLNDDEPRPVPIPKDFAHLMIRKIDEVCFSMFLTQVSAFAYLIVICNSLFFISFQVL